MQKERGALNIATIVIGAIVFCAMIGYYFWDKAKVEEAYGPSIDGMKKEERLAVKKNIVVLGVDERPEEDDPGRSDTLFVMMLDTTNKSIGLLSIPRDTRVHIPKYGYDKINHAYPLGGKDLTQRTVEEFLGLRINNYVMVDFKGFKGLVDAIGGVDIEIENDMYYRDSWDGFTIDLKKGKQHLTGETAIQYVRFRDEEGDLGRVRRQQHFLMAVYEKIASEELLKHIPGLAKQLSQMVKTDMNVSDMITMGRALHSMVKTTGIKMKTVPGEPKYIDDISYLIPDVQTTRKLMLEMQGSEGSERFKSASELLDREYKRNLAEKTAAEKKDKAKSTDKNVKPEVKKTATVKKAAEEKLKGLKEKQTSQKKNTSEEAPKIQIAPARKSIVVRVVNCSGIPAASDIAAARLSNAGFRVIYGGSGDVIPETTVISTTNNGAVVSKLSAVPFTHNLRISKDGAANCDGVIMLGKNFR